MVHRLEVLRVQANHFFDHTALGKFYFNTLLVLSVFSCFQYIFSTYQPAEGNVAAQQYIFGILELCLASLFLWDWCLNLFLAEHKIKYLTSFFSLVDLMTVIPKFSLLGSTCPLAVNSATDFVLYVLCMMQATRILRALRIRRRLLQIEDEVQRYVGEMILLVVVMILFSKSFYLSITIHIMNVLLDSAIMQYLEWEQEYDFNTCEHQITSSLNLFTINSSL